MDSIQETIVTDSGRTLVVTTTRRENETDADLYTRHKAWTKVIKEDQNPPE